MSRRTSSSVTTGVVSRWSRRSCGCGQASCSTCCGPRGPTGHYGLTGPTGSSAFTVTQPDARVTRSAVQSIANDTATAISFTQERYDNGGLFDPTLPTRFTVPAGMGGLYLMGGSVNFAADVDGYRRLMLSVNSILIADTATPALQGGIETPLTINSQYRLAVGDFVELYVKHTAGAALNVTQSSASTPEFWMTRVSA